MDSARRSWVGLVAAAGSALFALWLAAAGRVRSHFAAPILCLATVRASATHLDIHFALAQIDLDVRRAGLDQDPGWAPYFGHIVTFYFS